MHFCRCESEMGLHFLHPTKGFENLPNFFAMFIANKKNAFICKNIFNNTISCPSSTIEFGVLQNVPVYYLVGCKEKHLFKVKRWTINCRAVVSEHLCFWQRMDLGECPKIHDLALRADYEKAQSKKDYFYDLDVSMICNIIKIQGGSPLQKCWPL